MAQSSDIQRCRMVCMALGLVAGLIIAILFHLTGALFWPGALFLGLLIFLLVGIGLNWAFCSGVSQTGISQTGISQTGATRARAGTASRDASNGGGAATGARPGGAGTANVTPPAPAARGASPAAATVATAPVAQDAPAPSGAAGSATPLAKSPAIEPATTATSAGAAKGDGVAVASPANGMGPAGSAGNSAAGAAPATNTLPPETTTSAAPKEPAKTPAPMASKSTAAAPDEDGAVTGVKPPSLAAPRAGSADDLKEIKGVGPKLEVMLNGMGIYHFDQVAAWGPPEIAWVDANLKGFKGRASRDSWVGQAKVLAAGGETEFSKKVGKGGVY